MKKETVIFALFLIAVGIAIFWVLKTLKNTNAVIAATK